MYSYLNRIFGLDLRSLALFRISLGFLVVIDTILRLGDLKAHYTDQGVLPRHILIDPASNLLSEFGISAYFLGGSTPFILALMLLQIVIGFALIIGFKTRFVTVVAWLLIISLHSRNPLIITGGDSLLSVLLMWSIFLPLGARYSVDRALNSSSYDIPNHVSSFASAGLIIQVICVYVFNWLNKLDPVWIIDHTALYYTLHADIFVTHLGKILRNFLGLTQFLTMTIHMFQLIGPVLLLIPFWVQQMRAIVIIFFVMFHIGIALTLNIGYFPYVSIVSWLALTPAGFWDYLERRRERSRESFIMYYDGGCDFCIKTVLMFKTFLFLDATPIKEAQSDTQINAIFEENNTWVIRRNNKGLLTKWDAVVYAVGQSYYFSWLAPILRIRVLKKWGDGLYSHISSHRGSYSKVTSMMRYNNYRVKLGLLLSIVSAGLIVFVVYWNIGNVSQLDIDKPALISHVGSATRIGQKWSMFAPTPIKADGWLVAPGTLSDGSQVDVRTGNVINWEKPGHVADTYDNNRWRKYLVNLKKDKHTDQRVYYGKYICREWYSPGMPDGNSLQKFSLYFMQEYTEPPGESPTMERQLIWSHDCFSGK